MALFTCKTYKFEKQLRLNVGEHFTEIEQYCAGLFKFHFTVVS